MHRLSVFPKRWQTLCYVFTPISYVKVKPHFLPICFVCATSLCFPVSVSLSLFLFMNIYIIVNILTRISKDCSIRKSRVILHEMLKIILSSTSSQKHLLLINSLEIVRIKQRNMYSATQLEHFLLINSFHI